MASKETQLNVRLDPAVDRWLERAAGGRDKRADYIRRLVEEDMRRTQEEAEVAMFNRAAEDLTEQDIEEREQLLGIFSNRGE
ncbi:MAG TPA: hypothetical protein VF263_02940 [Longimicrobiaceae bacterium]